LTFGQVLDRSWKLGRANLKLFLGIASVPSALIFLVVAAALGCMVPMISQQIAATQATADPSTAIQAPATPEMFPLYLAGGLMVLLYPLMFAVFALYLPAASYAVTQADKGITVTIGQAYGFASRHFWRYLWLMILPALFVIVPLMVIACLVGVVALFMQHAGTDANSPAMLFIIPLAILLYIGLAVYSILLVLRFALAFPASVCEDLTAWDALMRSSKLTKGAKGRVFLVLLVVYAVSYAVNLVLLLVYFLVGGVGAAIALLSHVTQNSPAFFILIGLAGLGYLLVIMLCVMFSYAAYTTVLSVLYRDQRLRIDGPLPTPIAPPTYPTFPTPLPGEAV
jgi:hypothetical protein